MERHTPETIGVRRTGWAALDRDPQQDSVEFLCPHCGHRGQKNARRERTLYRFTDGFLQDLQGEVTQCHSCKQYLRVVPVVMLHDQDETRRFAAVFDDQLLAVPHGPIHAPRPGSLARTGSDRLGEAEPPGPDRRR